MSDYKREWKGVKSLTSRGYVCGHCGYKMASQRGYEGGAEYIAGDLNSQLFDSYYVYLCSHCDMPSFIKTRTLEDRGGVSVEIEEQIPPPKSGNNEFSPIKGLSGEVKTAYDEAVTCFRARAWTATAMLCRKMLMNISVSKGAKEGKKFAEYVNYLYDNRHITVDMRNWATMVKDVGNDANHKIIKASKRDAANALGFIRVMLTLTYEFPHKYEKKPKGNSSTQA